MIRVVFRNADEGVVKFYEVGRFQVEQIRELVNLVKEFGVYSNGWDGMLKFLDAQFVAEENLFEIILQNDR